MGKNVDINGKRIARVLILAGLVFGSVYAQNTINVPADYSTIQDGIDAAIDGDTVLVAEGTYIENINFNGKNIVVGSLFLTTGNKEYISQTIIDGNQAGSVVTFESGEDSTAVLTGFTITNGSADNGGGIYCSYSGPTLANVSPTLTNMLITGNSADNGGGVYCYSSGPTLANVTIAGNSASSNGGGIYCNYFSNPKLVNTILWYDLPEEVFIYSFLNSFIVSYSDVENGETGVVIDGDGVIAPAFAASIKVEAGIIYDLVFGFIPQATDGFDEELDAYAPPPPPAGAFDAALVYDGERYYRQILNGSNDDLVAHVWDVDLAFGDSALITISWNNSGWEDLGTFFIMDAFDGALGINVDMISESSLTLTNPAINSLKLKVTPFEFDGNEESGEDGIVSWRSSNINYDPLFVNPIFGNYNLQEDSPCIDVATADIDGDGTEDITNYYGLRPDIGAFEFEGGMSITDSQNSLPAKFELFNCYPNPFNPVTTVNYNLPKQAFVTFTVYDMLCREITKLVNTTQDAGYRSVQWNGRDSFDQPVSAGVYLYQIQAGEFKQTRKMIMLK